MYSCTIFSCVHHKALRSPRVYCDSDIFKLFKRCKNRTKTPICVFMGVKSASRLFAVGVLLPHSGDLKDVQAKFKFEPLKNTKNDAAKSKH